MPGIRDIIVNHAKWWAGRIQMGAEGKMEGADELVEMYKTTGPGGGSVLFGGGWSPIHEKGIRQGLWIRKIPLTYPPGQNQESVQKYCTGSELDGPVAWCGIFATFVLKKAGLVAHWANQKINCDNYVRWGKGVTGSPGDWKSQIEIGDICCLDTSPGASNNHHIIVVNVPPDTDKLDTVEGNMSNPRQSVQYLKGKRSRNDIYTLYKLKAESVESLHVGSRKIYLQL
jgi:hypothetical protein